MGCHYFSDLARRKTAANQELGDGLVDGDNAVRKIKTFPLDPFDESNQDGVLFDAVLRNVEFWSNFMHVENEFGPLPFRVCSREDEKIRQVVHVYDAVLFPAHPG